MGDRLLILTLHLQHRHQLHQLKGVIHITIKIAFLMDTLLTRLVTRYGYQMALKRTVQLCGKNALLCKNAVGLPIVLVVCASLPLALLLVLPLLHLSAVQRRNFVQRILTAVKVNATRKRINARNNLDPSCYLIDMLAFKVLNVNFYLVQSSNSFFIMFDSLIFLHKQGLNSVFLILKS